MRWRIVTASLATVVFVLLALAAPASAGLRRGSLAYPYGDERPRLEYRVVWGVVDSDTVRTTKIMVRATNPQRPYSRRNWASVTVFVGGVHPGAREAPWDGHAGWWLISGSGEGEAAGSGEAARLKAQGAEVVWTTEMYLGSGAWKTRYVPVGQRRSERYETWVRVRFHASGRSHYWFRLTSPIG